MEHPIDFRQVYTAQGLMAPAPVVLLDKVHVGGALVRNVETLVLDLPPGLGVDGLLGSTFLRHFGVTLEYDRSTVVFRET